MNQSDGRQPAEVRLNAFSLGLLEQLFCGADGRVVRGGPTALAQCMIAL
jgi:hypothetical protein